MRIKRVEIIGFKSFCDRAVVNIETSVTGKLAGPLHVEHITLDHERVHIEIEQLDIDLTPAYLLSNSGPLK